MHKVGFTETVLRDANQSLMATRLGYKDFEPILKDIDSAGYYSVECWGGATFDSCLRYLNEDPWERLRNIRKNMPNSKLQMLLRGQNLLGYRHYPDDVVRKFIELAVKNGIDIIRTFDALNDVHNIEVAVDETLKNGAHASGAICYTISPIHDTASYIRVAKDMKSMGVNSICIKDMAGILSPAVAYELVSSIKEAVDLPLIVHTHSTTGLSFMTLLKSVEAGADVIDTAISSFSGGTSQPATETLNYALSELGYDTGLSKEKLNTINAFFKPIRDAELKSGRINGRVLATDTDALNYQIPGGMLSNLISQLTQQGQLEKFPEVLEETPRVKEDLGYPPLVTPMSQMVGQQAVVNVLSGGRYKIISNEVKSYLAGEYGTPPGEVNEELREKALAGHEMIKGRYADTLPPLFEKTKEELKGVARSDEDVMSYISFPQVAEKFFEDRQKAEEKKALYSIEAIED